MNNSSLDVLWLLLSGVLVLLMQAGFLCLESGATRSKNAINVAMKNATDFVISVILFWVVGFALMFGESHGGLLGGSQFFTNVGHEAPWLAAFFLFQTMFCATAATIVSGAIAERVRFSSYHFITVMVVVFIYPVSGHWAWGGVLGGTRGWLAELGFVDFAGSTVVHSVGGWVALAAVLIVGPRTGRFVSGVLQPIPGSNAPLALLGVLFFIVGWVGFNGGSTLALNASVPGIVANTILAASSGAVTSLLFCKIYPGKCIDSTLVFMNGILAGLVAITANCHAVTPGDAVIIGAIGALVTIFVDRLLMRYQIDDAIGAIPVHLGAGIWGTIAVALFGDPVKLGTKLDFISQLEVQVLGIVVIGVWAFVVAYVLLSLLNRMFPIRVSVEDEEKGLNVSEHGAVTELNDLMTAMKKQEDSADLSLRVPVEPFTEVGQIASKYNRVMDSLENAIQQTKSIVRDIRDGIITFRENGILTSFNPGAEKIFGVLAADAIGNSFCSMLDSSANIICQSHSIKKDEMSIEKLTRMHKSEVIGRRQDNSQFFMELTVTKSLHNGMQQYTGLIRDITDRKKIEEELFQQKERALVTLESIADGVITTTAEGIVKYMNAAAEYFTCWSSKEAEGRLFEEVYNAVDDNKKKRSSSVMSNVLNKHDSIYDTNTYTLVGKNGKEYAVKHTASPIRNRKGEVIGAVVVFHDVTSTREMQRQLSHQATHDSLTGLKNRNAFETKTIELIADAQTEGSEHILCYLDLDQFKLVNDTCGHFAGDELLRQVAALIKAHLRTGDTVARLGGDEFGILLYGCNVDHGREVAENIRESIREFRFPWDGKQFSIGVSIGLIRIEPDTENLTQLLSLADAACYAAKDLGRNRVHIYETNDKELANRQGQMQWVTRIQEALDQDRLRLYFQSISPASNVQQKSGHYELFIRMLDEEGGIIPPGAFIPAAERYDLMKDIDKWVVHNALAWLGDQHRKGNSEILSCSINLSGASVGDAKFLADIKAQFIRHKLRPGLVCFEITETTAIANIQSATHFIEDLKKIGCKFALDDFGSGLSSFAYLKNLPVDYLKIDGTFIKDIDKNSMDYAMVQSIHTIGHVMGLKTVAEFVETESILSCLQEIGIDYVQGYYIDRPKPLEQLEGVVFMPR